MPRAEMPPAILGPDTAFEGLAHLRGPVSLEGRLRGEIVATGSLWIGEHAEVAARIEADEVIVAGQFDGEIRARDRIQLLPTARVHAVLVAPRVVVAEGCFFEGDCRAGAGAAETEPELARAPRTS